MATTAEDASSAVSSSRATSRDRRRQVDGTPWPSRVMLVCLLVALVAVTAQVFTSMQSTAPHPDLQRRAPQGDISGSYTSSAVQTGSTDGSSSSTDSGSTSTESIVLAAPSNIDINNLDAAVIDPRTPPGLVTFTNPMSYWKAEKIVIQQTNANMNVSWTYQNVTLGPRIVTIQYYPPTNWEQTVVGGFNESKEEYWRSVGVNISATPTYYIWKVQVPEARNYILRIFDSELGANAQKAGRMLTGKSGYFHVYKSTDIDYVDTSSAHHNLKIQLQRAVSYWGLLISVFIVGLLFLVPM